MVYQKTYVYCPVCKKDSFLGSRYEQEAFSGRCGECRVTYHFAPHKDMPYKNESDKKLAGKCGCGGCKARDGE